MFKFSTSFDFLGLSILETKTGEFEGLIYLGD